MMDQETLRLAELADIPAMMWIRNHVRENALVNRVIGHDDYVQAMTVDGRAWVAEVAGEVAGFVCARTVQADIWALFVDARFERRGLARRLMDLAEAHMFEQGLASIRLTTAAGTRAERLYQARGWTDEGVDARGERHFRLDAPTAGQTSARSLELNR